MIRGLRGSACGTLALLFGAVGCGDGPSGDESPEESAPFAALGEFASPAGPGSGEPNLFAGEDGRVYLTWFERREGSQHALLLSVLEPDGGPDPQWSPPRTVAEGRDFWVNWADFPSLYAFPDGLLAVHWPERSGVGTYDYNVMVAWSDDGGESWSEPVVPHRDGVPAEHGFVSFFPVGDRELGAVWLDGRHFAGWDEELGGVGEAGRPEHPEMTLRFTTLTPAAPPAAGLGVEELLDARICDCCQTSAALTSRGPVVVYRDRSPDEVRDISIVRRDNGSWTEPRSVAEDGWVIPACPVNGPMVAAEGEEVVVAWFTAEGERPRVHAAFSSDAGDQFSAPIRVDEGDPGGRVATVLLPSGNALVSWLERREGGAEVLVRQVGRDGSLGAPEVVARSSAARSSGFPRMVRSGQHLVFAWTDAGEDAPRQVRTALAQLQEAP